MDLTDVFITAITVSLAGFVIYLLKVSLSDDHSFKQIICLDNRFLCLYEIYHSGGDGDSFFTCRFKVSHLSTGNQLYKSKEFTEDCKIIGRVGETVWIFDRYEKVFAFNMNQLKILFDKKNIYDVFPDLKKTKIGDLKLDIAKNKIFFTSNTGYSYSIDCLNHVINQEAFPNIENKNSESTRHGFSLVKADGTERYVVFKNQEKIFGDSTFLKPEILLDSETGKPILGKNNDAVLVLHYETLDENRKFIITGASLKTKKSWNILQENLGLKKDGNKKEFYFISEQGDFALVCIENKLLLFNIEDGRIQWIKNI